MSDHNRHQLEQLEVAVAFERALLGAAMLYAEVLPVALALKGPDFFKEAHRLIHAAIAALAAREVEADNLAVAGELADRGQLDEAGGRSYLGLLLDEAAVPSSAPECGARIRDASLKRALERLGHQLVPSEIWNGRPAGELVRFVETEIGDLTAKNAARQAAPTPTLTVLGAGDFLAQRDGEPEAYIEGILSDDGGGWIGGEDKTGKTWWMIEEASCLALKLPVCGRFAVPTRRRVAVLEEEDSPRRTRRRLRANLRGKGLDPDDPIVQADLNAWFRVAVWSGFTFDNPALVDQLRALILEFRPSVVYIDCLRKVTIRDLNKAPEASALLAILDALRREFGVIFRLVHHYRKVQGFRAGRGSQEIGGSYVLGAWGENSLFFEPVGRKQGAVHVEVQSKDGAPVPGFRLRLESEGPAHAPTLVRLTAEDDAGADDLDEFVFQAVATLPKTEALVGKPGVPLEAIAAAVKRSVRTVRRPIKSLEESGRILAIGQLAKQKLLYGVKE